MTFLAQAEEELGPLDVLAGSGSVSLGSLERVPQSIGRPIETLGTLLLDLTWLISPAPCHVSSAEAQK